MMASLKTSIIFQIVMQIVILCVFLGVVIIAEKYAPQDISVFSDLLLAISSILLGFLSSAVNRHLEEVRKQQKQLSDLAADLLILLEKIRGSPELSKKIIHYNPKYDDWGFNGTSAEMKAESLVLVAYDYLLKNVRTVISACRRGILLWAIPSILLLLSNISLNIISKLILIERKFIVTTGLISILFGTFMILVEWWVANSMLDRQNDSLINIQHSILGDIYRGTSFVGYIKKPRFS